MGEFLTKPVDVKDNQDGDNEFLHYGICSMQAWEKRMENTYINEVHKSSDENGNFDIFGIFDGHGGAEVAQFLKIHFCKELYKNKKFSSDTMKEALKETFFRMDELMLKEEGKKELRKLRKENIQKEKESLKDEVDINNKDIEILQKMLVQKEEEEENVADLCGATGCVGVVDKKKKKITFAIIGNSKVIYAKSDRPDRLSADNKPTDEAERIAKAGGWVIDNLVKGNLNTTRSFGDFEYKKGKNPNKHIIIVDPGKNIAEHKIDPSEEYILMVSEGVYDCIQEEDICKIINADKNMRNIDLKKGKISDVLSNMYDKIIAEDIYNNLGKAYNNMTSILIKIK